MELEKIVIMCREGRIHEIVEFDEMKKDFKHCSKCKKRKPMSEFSKNKNSLDGLQNWCKACQSKYHKMKKEKTKKKPTISKKSAQAKPNITKLFSRIVGLVDEFKYFDKDNILIVNCPTLQSFLAVCKILQENGDIQVHANSRRNLYEIDVKIIS